MIRISYTLLSLFEKNPDEAYLYYIGVRQNPTKQMIAGKEFDNYVCSYAAKNRSLPEEFGNMKLNIYMCVQRKLEFEDKQKGFTFVFVPDIYDRKFIYEIKTGNTSLSDYANTMQIPCYFYGFEMLGRNKKGAFLLHKDDGVAVIHNSPKVRKRAKEWIYDNFDAFYRTFKDGL